MDIYMYRFFNDEQDPETLPTGKSFQVPKYPVKGETVQNGNSHSSPGVSTRRQTLPILARKCVHIPRKSMTISLSVGA